MHLLNEWVLGKRHVSKVFAECVNISIVKIFNVDLFVPLELHMDLTNYYELKYQPHNLRTFPETMAGQVGEGEERLSIGRSRSPICPSSRQSSSASGEGTAMHLTHPHQGPGEGRVTAQHLEELCKERWDKQCLLS